MQSEIKVGSAATHKVLGNCVVVRITKTGSVWVSVWSGPTGDKTMIFKGYQLADLKIGHNQKW